MIKIEEANLGHAYDLSLHLSRADIVEVIAIGGIIDDSQAEIESALAKCVTEATHCWALVNSRIGLTLAIGGVLTEGHRKAGVFMLTSKMMDGQTMPVKIKVWQMLRDHLKKCNRNYGNLANWVHAGNKAHIEFLKSMGAEFIATTTTEDKDTFLKFVLWED